MKFAFVILHYMAIEDTVECIESFNNLNTRLEYSLVIVDNCSPDQSGNKLKEMFANKKNVHVLMNKENSGFARGNNAGIRFAKSNLNADIVVCINNDTKIIQGDFLEKVLDEYEKSHFWILGPMILTKDGRYISNPLRSLIRTKSEVEKALYIKKKELFYLRHRLDGFQQLWKKAKAILKNDCIKGSEISLSKNINIALHGSCLILSPEFFKCFSGFDERTFLYSEENILYSHVMAEKGLMVYSPEVRIYHKEDASTDISNGSGRNKKLFVIENEIKSLEILEKVLDENEKR